jgi:hypothetical protein
MEIKTRLDDYDTKRRFQATIEEREFAEGLLPAIFDKIADKLADQIILELGPEIMKRLDPQAIANLTIAAAAAKVNETLNKKMPDKILETVRTETQTRIFQRGLFGGVREIR